MKILVTGAAGFIGFHTVKRLAERGDEVVGIDCLNDYYDVELKLARLKASGIGRTALSEHIPVQSEKYPGYCFIRADLTDKAFLDDLFETRRFDAVCNLAAQAGVRYSIENPYAYVNSNICGFLNILEACRHYPVKHLVYASSSSVYGQNEKIPFSETDRVDEPVSLYAATKKSGELMAYTYGKLYGIPSTGLRFFTVYGPWGRPDMAPSLFLQSILEGTTINVFNGGRLYRDFTYIDDIVQGVTAVIDRAPEEEIPYRIYNIGNGHPVLLTDFIEAIEKAAGKKALCRMLDMQPGDVYRTYADTSALEREFGYHPDTALQTGIERFYRWFVAYRNGEFR